MSNPARRKRPVSYRPLGGSSRRYAVAPRVSLLTLLGVCCAGGLVVPSIPDYACSEMTTHDDACSCPGRSRTTCYACAVFLAASGRVVNFFSESGSRCFRVRRSRPLVRSGLLRRPFCVWELCVALRCWSYQRPRARFYRGRGSARPMGLREESLRYFLTT